MITVKIVANSKNSLHTGVISEMARYDGGYEKIEYGKQLQGYKHLPEEKYYESIIITSKRVTIARWKSFNCSAE